MPPLVEVAWCLSVTTQRAHVWAISVKRHIRMDCRVWVLLSVSILMALVLLLHRSLDPHVNLLNINRFTNLLYLN
jgi:hypothetical protein